MVSRADPILGDHIPIDRFACSGASDDGTEIISHPASVAAGVRRTKRPQPSCPVYRGGRPASLYFSVDGRNLASGSYGGMVRRGPDSGIYLKQPDETVDSHDHLDLWDLVDPEQHHALVGGLAGVTGLDFSSDGWRLVSGHRDSTALVWDVTQFRRRLTEIRLSEAELAALWSQLGDEDEKLTYQGIAKLYHPPEQVIPFMTKRLQVEPADPQEVAAWVAKQDADAFGVRQQATQRLRELGPATEKSLGQAIEQNYSAEVKLRVEKLLAAIQAGQDPERRQRVRGQEALEGLWQWGKNSPV